MYCVRVCREIQITFKDRAFRNGFRIVTFDSPQLQQQQHPRLDAAQQESITGCIMERLRNVNDVDVVTSTCQTGIIVRLRANQILAIATIDGYYKPMVMSQHLTYWGLYKIDHQ